MTECNSSLLEKIKTHKRLNVSFNQTTQELCVVWRKKPFISSLLCVSCVILWKKRCSFLIFCVFLSSFRTLAVTFVSVVSLFFLVWHKTCWHQFVIGLHTSCSYWISDVAFYFKYNRSKNNLKISIYYCFYWHQFDTNISNITKCNSSLFKLFVLNLTLIWQHLCKVKLITPQACWHPFDSKYVTSEAPAVGSCGRRN